MIIEADVYAQKILSGEIVACKWVKSACQRHLENYNDDSLYMNYERIEKAINFIENNLRHFEGQWRGTLIKLEDWQKFIIQNIFGWSHKESGYRLYRYAYIEVARKNGKTTLAAIIIIISLFIDKDPTPQILVGANDEKQAKITTHITGQIIEISQIFAPYLKNENIKLYKYNGETSKVRIKTKNRDGVANCISRNLDTKDGSNPSVGVIDEYHAAKEDGLLNVLESGQGVRVEPLIFVTTTAGFNKDGPCYSKLRHTATRLLDNNIEDKYNFCIIYTLDEDDDWEDSTTWVKSNPMISSNKTLENYLQIRHTRAKNEGGSKVVEFKTKNLNIWSDTDEIWIPSDIYNDGLDKDFELKHDLASYDCWGGLDLASTRDISAFALVWKVGDFYYKKEWYWCPEEGFEKRIADGYSYDLWYQDGYIKLTSGNITDYRVIEADIVELCTIYNVKFINYDRKDAFQLINILSDDHNINCYPFTQSYTEYHTPMTEYENNFHRGVVRHDGNPVTNWMMGNVRVKRSPRDGAIMPNKAETKQKIDGVVADIMAFAGAYEKEVDTNPGIIII